MTTSFLQQLIKNAATTYDYKASAKRSYYPKKSTIKPGVVKVDTGTSEEFISIPKESDDNFPKAVNKADNRESWPFGTFLHSFSPTVSGTGYGRPYWSTQSNPFWS